MADDETGEPLSRRVPGAARPGPGQAAKPVLSDSTLNRMQAAIEAERAQAEPEHLVTEPRYHDDPNTEPLPAVTSSGAPVSRRAKRGRNPSGTGPDPGVLPESARKLEAVAEIAPDEEPLRVARALRAAQPEPVPAVEPAAVRAVGPEPVRALEPEPVRALEPEPVRAAGPSPVRAAGPEPIRAAGPEPVRAVEPAPLRAVAPEPVRAAGPAPVRAGEPEPPAPPELPPAWWAAAPAASETGPTPGTIGWLWPEDTATRGAGGGGPRWRPPRRWGYRAATLVTLAAGVLLGAGLFIGIALHSSHPAGVAHGNSTPKVTAPPATADPMPSTAPAAGGNGGGLAFSLTQAAAWVNAQVGSGSQTLVACDTQTCAALTQAGFPALQQVQVQENPQAVTTANVLVVDPTVRSYLGSHPGLANYVTPTILASFGQVTIQVIDPAGAAAYQTALNADVQARIQLGDQLLNSGQVTASPAAQGDLENGDVDPSLLLALQSLADQQPIDVLEFADAGPSASAGAPYRGVALAVSDPASGMSQSAYDQWLAQVVDGHTTFPAPLKAGPVTLPDGQTAAGFEYAAPTQLGQLG